MEAQAGSPTEQAHELAAKGALGAAGDELMHAITMLDDEISTLAATLDGAGVLRPEAPIAEAPSIGADGPAASPLAQLIALQAARVRSCAGSVRRLNERTDR